MRILVHDYPGHPFQIQLSRELARRGHQTLHLYCHSLPGAKGATQMRASDPDSFRIHPITLPSEVRRGNLFLRSLQERAYTPLVLEQIAAHRPDVVLSANAPLPTQAAIARACSRNRHAFVFWLQDVYSLAIPSLTRGPARLLAPLAAILTHSLEARTALASTRIVVISDDFKELLSSWGVRSDLIDVVPNWAPIEELPMRPRDNAWAADHGLAGIPTLLYSGTLGHKHSPDAFLQLANAVRHLDACVVVVGEGRGLERLRQVALKSGMFSLRILPTQPYDRLPDVLAAADVLIATLQGDAAGYSVPSKIYSYLCAGRPIAALMPVENAGARVIVDAAAGIVVPPKGQTAFGDATRALLEDADRRRRFGTNARKYAEQHFNISLIADRFERILERAIAGR